MHTPDGFITGWVCVVMLLAALIPVLFALNNLRRNMTKEKALKIAALAALVFAAQMLNFPVTGGTSGHLVGAALLVVLLGVDAAVIVMSSVLLVQALAFGDGGLFSLGANVFNMAVVGCYAASFAYGRLKTQSSFLAIFAASWLGVFIASLVLSLELAASGTVALLPSLLAMGSVHALIGIGEGLITILLVNALLNRRLDNAVNFAIASTAFSFLALAVLLPYASTAPDGLGKVALNLGFFSKAVSIYAPPFAAYGLVAALVGMALSFAVVLNTLSIINYNHARNY